MTASLSRASLVLVASVLLLAGASRPSAEIARRHLRLVKSAPAADSVITRSPAAIQLWFSEKVELGATRVRLVGPDEKPVALGAVTQEKAADAPVRALVTGTLANGAYTVNWTATSGDSHVVKGAFRFTLRAP
jgi:methionine-rich copper-binding protein CopC